LAAAASVSLLCRPPAGVGLILTFGALFLWELWKRRVPFLSGKISRSNLLAFLIVPALILAIGVATAGWVNYERFGNPTTFVNALGKPKIEQAPRRYRVDAETNTFETIRLIPALAYYFLGLPITKLWPNLTDTYYDDIGWPRSILLAKETLLIGFAFAGFAT